MNIDIFISYIFKSIEVAWGVVAVKFVGVKLKLGCKLFIRCIKYVVRLVSEKIEDHDVVPWEVIDEVFRVLTLFGLDVSHDHVGVQRGVVFFQLVDELIVASELLHERVS